MRTLPRIWLVILALILSTMGVGGWRYLHTQEALRRAEAEAALNAVAVLKINDISAWVNGRKADARMLVINPTLNRAMRIWVKSGGQGEGWSAELLETARARLAMPQEAYGYRDIRLADGGNHPIVCLSPCAPLSEDIFSIAVMNKARRTGRAEFGDIHQGEDGKPVLDVAMPLFADNLDAALRESGVTVLMEIDPEQYLYPMLRSWPVPTQTAETLLARRIGDTVQFVSPLRHRAGPPLAFSMPLDRPDLPAAMALRGEEGVLRGVDYRGVPVLAVGRRVADTGWVMIAKIDEDEALATQYRETLMGLWVLLAAAAAVAAVTLLAWVEASSGQREKVELARAETLEKEAKLASIFRAAPVGIGIVRNRHLVEVNDAFGDLTGFTRSELLGISTRRFYAAAAEYVRVGKEAFAQMERKGHASIEAVWKNKKGGAINVILSAAPVDPADPKGDVSFTVTDITRIKRQEKQLQRRRSELERSNKELTTFAYVASHDLRSPLRGISQLAEWIVEDMPEAPSEEVSNHLRLMKSRIARMERLLDDLLAYSRVGRIEGDMVEISVADLCREAFDMATPPEGFSLQLDGEFPKFVTLATPLTQVLRNLIGNAVKHHDKTNGVIAVSSRQEGETFVIAVADDGPGIPPEFHERVFGLFQTLKPRDAVEGSGMGLALVKKIVELYGGTVTLASDGKRGSTFTFTWPDEAKLREVLDARKQG
jgi:PAS domain S-box-containing protein